MSNAMRMFSVLLALLVLGGCNRDPNVAKKRYLENGNMVVVEDARADIGRTLRVAVTGIHQTRAGTLIFARKREAGDSPLSVVEGHSNPAEGAARS